MALYVSLRSVLSLSASEVLPLRNAPVLTLDVDLLGVIAPAVDVAPPHPGFVKEHEPSAARYNAAWRL